MTYNVIKLLFPDEESASCAFHSVQTVSYLRTQFG